MKVKDRREHFWSHVFIPPEEMTVGACWQWTGTTSNGYGKYGSIWAHRFSWELLRGPIPHNLEVDHLCRNRGCVNPEHLEIVSHRENVRRGHLCIDSVPLAA
jgi:hypothetical protein